MRQANIYRILTVVVVTAISLSCTWPSARYYMALRKPDPKAGIVAKVHFDPSTDAGALTGYLETAGFQVERVAAVGGTDNFEIGVRAPEPGGDLAALEANLRETLSRAYSEDGQEVLRVITLWERELEDMAADGIPLGLDLYGGADVTLKIDETESQKRAMRQLADRLDRVYRDEQISAKVKVSDDEMSVIVEATKPAEARQIANILSRPEFGEELRDVPGPDRFETRESVRLEYNTASLSARIAEDIEGAKRIVSDRLNEFGLANISVTVQNNDQIRVQMPGEKDPQPLIDRLTRLAVMEFRLAHDQWDSLTPTLLDERGRLREGAVVPLGYELLDYRFGRLNNDTAQIEYEEGKMLVREEARFTGGNLQDVRVYSDQMDINNPIKIAFTLDVEGTQIFKDITTASKEQFDRTGVAQHLAVVLDGTVISAPEMKVVIVGNGVIEGGFTYEEADDLTKQLKGGSLPAPLVVENQYTVGATLGNESILSGVRALSWGAAIIVVFMIAYYRVAGVISIVALFLNVLLITTFMDMARATLTLSGIGGILLTMGMAVDANVLIYERIREEIDAGRPMRQAISVGFDRAYRVILDSNLTTLMTAMVLLQFTEGQVFGFALTLSIGLIANLYTGLFVSSTLCAAWFQWRSKLSLGGLRPFAASTYDFLRMCKPAWVVSVAALALCIGGVMTRGGIVLGVDFEGGVLTEVRFNAETGEGDIRAALSAGGLEGQRVQRIAGDTVDYIVRVKSLEESAAAPVEGAGPGGALKTTADRLRAALETQYGADGFTVLQTSSFGPETGQRFQSMALSVLFLAAIAILVYLWLRFELIFGVGAVVALVHDMILTLFGASLWGVEISLAEVAAMMVMLGFSVNDTIVIFDRIRENGRKITGKTFEEICNISINQSLSRTIITSGTTFLAVIAMLLIGGEGLKPFAKVLLIGSIVGTYSTMFIATPVVVAWNRRRRNKTLEALAAKAKSVGGEKVGAPAAAGARAPRQTAV